MKRNLISNILITTFLFANTATVFADSSSVDPTRLPLNEGEYLIIAADDYHQIVVDEYGKISSILKCSGKHLKALPFQGKKAVIPAGRNLDKRSQMFFTADGTYLAGDDGEDVMFANADFKLIRDDTKITAVGYDGTLYFQISEDNRNN